MDCDGIEIEGDQPIIFIEVKTISTRFFQAIMNEPHSHSIQEEFWSGIDLWQMRVLKKMVAFPGMQASFCIVTDHYANQFACLPIEHTVYFAPLNIKAVERPLGDWLWLQEGQIPIRDLFCKPREWQIQLSHLRRKYAGRWKLINRLRDDPSSQSDPVFLIMGNGDDSGICSECEIFIRQMFPLFLGCDAGPCYIGGVNTPCRVCGGVNSKTEWLPVDPQRRQEILNSWED